MRRYALIMDGDKTLVTIDGSGKPFEGYLNTFKSAGYSVKEVTKEEFKKEEARQDELLWDKDGVL